MATIKFTASDVARLLGLPGTQAVEDLISAKVIDVSGYTRQGRPLFDIEGVRRAADHVVSRREAAPPA